MFSVAFLNRVQAHLPSLPYHVARKKIPCIDDAGQPVQPKAPNGIKLEVCARGSAAVERATQTRPPPSRRCLGRSPGLVGCSQRQLFVFDVFQFANQLAVLYVDRTTEFSPLKNASGAADGTPETSRADLMAVSRRMLEAAGAQVRCGRPRTCCGASPLGRARAEWHGMMPRSLLTPPAGLASPSGPVGQLDTAASSECEVSPLVSYAGEGLAALHGKRIALPVHIDSQATLAALASS